MSDLSILLFWAVVAIILVFPMSSMASRIFFPIKEPSDRIDVDDCMEIMAGLALSLVWPVMLIAIGLGWLVVGLAFLRKAIRG